MSPKRWVFANAQGWDAMCQRLKHTPCPHCHVVGALIRHGTLRGYDDQNIQHKTLRAYRLFCSNRHQRPGCGETRPSGSEGREWR